MFIRDVKNKRQKPSRKYLQQVWQATSKESQDLNKKERKADLKGMSSRQNANMASEDL